jgi:hypothetical protein
LCAIIILFGSRCGVHHRTTREAYRTATSGTTHPDMAQLSSCHVPIGPENENHPHRLTVMHQLDSGWNLVVRRDFRVMFGVVMVGSRGRTLPVGVVCFSFHKFVFVLASIILPKTEVHIRRDGSVIHLLRFLENCNLRSTRSIDKKLPTNSSASSQEAIELVWWSST